ncbi:hypothetical protein ABZ508_01330 [Streptomyces lavendulocolor]|uniref:Secreted protein n=1 Tax=Streptomyces lavendulocolor TaxID=67316 RepID=A0ABV2VXJ9_9ACTN
MRTRSKSMMVAATTAALLAGAASAATAAGGGPGATLAATTTGAYGNSTISFAGKTYADSIYFRAVDTAADGNHARIRLVTKRSNGSLAYWSWRANYDGSMTEKEWYTSLSDPQGITAVLIQVCRAEGDTLLNCANSEWKPNTYW